MTVCDRSPVVSEMDVEHLARLRENVYRFMRHVAATYAKGSSGRLLDGAPPDHAGARPFFGAALTVETFDINPEAGTTHVGDLCQTNACLADDASSSSSAPRSSSTRCSRSTPSANCAGC